MNIKRSACSFFTPFYPTPCLICIIMMYQRNLVTFYLRACLVTACNVSNIIWEAFLHPSSGRSFPMQLRWRYHSAVICNTFQVIDFSRGARCLHKSYYLWRLNVAHRMFTASDVETVIRASRTASLANLSMSCRKQ